jgi:hypothetical protein
MGISLAFAKFLIDVSGSFVAESPEKSTPKALSLGYPDMLFSPQAIKGIGREGLKDSQMPYEESDSESLRIRRYHGINATGRLASAKWFFSFLGYDLESLDFKQLQGSEIVADLSVNGSVDFLRDKYHLVVDNGTIEHIFNAPTALMNVASMVAPGGCAVHANPFIMPNHGFWSMNPTLYSDFYRSNGFEIAGIFIVRNSDGALTRLAPEQYTQRFHLSSSDECCIWTVARKCLAAVDGCIFPIQTKYREMLS